MTIYSTKLTEILEAHKYSSLYPTSNFHPTFIGILFKVLCKLDPISFKIIQLSVRPQIFTLLRYLNLHEYYFPMTFQSSTILSTFYILNISIIQIYKKYKNITHQEAMELVFHLLQKLFQ